MFENFDLSKMSAMLEEAQKQAQKMQEQMQKQMQTVSPNSAPVAIAAPTR